MIYMGIPVESDFATVLGKLAEKEDVLPHKILLDLAHEGLNCRRMHKASKEVIRRNK